MKKVALTVAVLALGLAACESKTEEAVENVAVENAVESDVNAAEVAVDNALDAAGNAVENAGEAVENAADATAEAAENAAQ
jgi:hypothetical protein